MTKRILLFAAAVCCLTVSNAQEKERQWALDNYMRYTNEAKVVKDSAKEQAIEQLRQRYHKQPYRNSQIAQYKDPKALLDLLNEEGRFTDLIHQEEEYRSNGAFFRNYTTTTEPFYLFLSDLFVRIGAIADGYRRGVLSEEEATSNKVWKAIIYYSLMEIERSNDVTRFHTSCFSIPTSMSNTYFCYLKEMEEVESGANTEPLRRQACDLLKAVSFQAWSQPQRKDHTDNNVVSIDRWRNHVWWVGGNALAYRSLLPVAAMFRSIPMVDLLSEISMKGISMTSQHTYHDAFWNEGFTADGAGWGHGKQCLIWGYPIDGIVNALGMLGQLKGTPWAKQLERANVDAMLNFLRGSSWYYYKGFVMPGVDRNMYSYRLDPRSVPYAGMLNGLVSNWFSSFTKEEQTELLQLQKEVNTNFLNMPGYPDGQYAGTRWFFNNDDLFKKTPDYHIMINMASSRCDGLESADDFADGYNFYAADGSTLFQRNGNEYNKIVAGWDFTTIPGITAREGAEQLKSITNWRGYRSRFNYAAGATDGGSEAVGGYIFQKTDGEQTPQLEKNPILYGVKAHKSYFIMGDYFVALGAGVTNTLPELEGTIRTSIDQTDWSGEVVISRNGKQTALAAGRQLPIGGKEWVIQKGKFAYRILPEFTKHAFVSCQTRPAEWVKRNSTNKGKPNLPKEVNILSVWTDHGRQPQNDTYGYVVYCGQDVPTDKLPFFVLRNDTLVQAVQSIDRKTLQAVFYPGASSLKQGKLSLSVSAPCAVLISEEDKHYRITATDACMNIELKEIRIVYNGKSIVVPMPQGEWSGRPSTVVLLK